MPVLSTTPWWRRVRMPMCLTALLCYLALILSTCNQPADEPSSPPNIILVSLDTLRADHLGLHGYHRNTSPFLDQLATRSLVFEQAVVNTHGTTPSHTTMLAGLYQETHRVGIHSDPDGLALPIPPTVDLLPEVLQQHGYITLGVTDGGNIGKRFGFARGFNRYDERGGGIQRVLRRARRYLDDWRLQIEERPFFLLLHTYEIHSPYAPPAEHAALFLNPESPSTFEATSENLVRFANSADLLAPADLERVSDLYDAGIHYTDHELGAFVAHLEEQGLLENTVLVVTSDHGEEFAEHGGLLHRGHLYDELLRVPLLFSGPMIEPGSSPAAASLVDIVPTLLGLTGLSWPSDLQGRDLLSPSSDADVAISQYANALYSVRSPEWKLIVSPEAPPQLFDLHQDPQEQQNVYAADHPKAQTFRQKLRAWLAADRPAHTAQQATALSAEERKKLEGLGYLTN